MNRFPYFVAPVSIFGHPVSAPARLIYLCLAAEINRTGEKFSRQTLPRDTALSAEEVERALDELQDHELLELIPGAEGEGEFEYTLYPPEKTPWGMAERPGELPSEGEQPGRTHPDPVEPEPIHPKEASAIPPGQDGTVTPEPASLQESDETFAPDSATTELEPESGSPAGEEPVDPLVAAYEQAFGTTPPRSLVEAWATLPPEYVFAQLNYCSRIVARQPIYNLPAFVRTALEHDYAEHSSELVGTSTSEVEKEAKLQAIRETLRMARDKEKKKRKRRRVDPWGPYKEPK